MRPVEQLQRNLAALRAVDAALAERLSSPRPAPHVIEASDGAVFYKVSQTPLRLSIAGSMPSMERTNLLLGVGAGELLLTAIATAGDRLIAYERDPALWQLALSRVDVVEALQAGRLRVCLGVDLLEELPLPADAKVLSHPVLGELYTDEHAWIQGQSGARRALVLQGGLFVRELTRELRRRGFAPFPLHLGHVDPTEALRTARKLAPELIVAVNVPPGAETLAAQAGVSLLCWEIDPAVHLLKVPAHEAERAFVFTFRERYVDELKTQGYVHVEHLPLAADPTTRAPVSLTAAEREHYGARVCFVGTSMVEDAPRWERLFLKAYAQRRPAAEGRSVLASVLAAQRRDFGHDGVALALANHCRGFGPTEMDILARCAQEIAAAERRVVYASRLGRFGLQVWGDAGWRVAEGAGVRYRGTAGSYTDLNAIYCSAGVNVDIGRLHQLDIVTMRIFDVMACGGFVLAERSKDLERLFEIGREVDCYSTLEELEQKVDHYLTHPNAARALAEAGRRAVLERHTVAQRVDRMLQRMAIPTA